MPSLVGITYIVSCMYYAFYNMNSPLLFFLLDLVVDSCMYKLGQIQVITAKQGFKNELTVEHISMMFGASNGDGKAYWPCKSKIQSSKCMCCCSVCLFVCLLGVR